MAGKQAQYEDALGSIFDFIFKNANKKGKGLKPPKPTGVSPTNDFSGALAEMAANPYYYANSAFLGLFDEAFNQSIVEFNVDKKAGWHRSGRLRVRPREALTLLRNPGKYVDSVFKKAAAERKWTYKGAGAILDTALGTYWASKHAGFDFGDALVIGKAAGKISDWQTESFAENMLSENAGVKYLLEKGKRTEARQLSDAIRGLGSRINDTKLEDILSRIRITPAQREKVLSEYIKSSRSVHRDFKDSDGKLSPSGYRDILNQNLSIRSRIARTPEELEQLQKGIAAVSTWQRLKLTDEDVNFAGMRDDIDAAIISLEGRRASTSWSTEDERSYRELLGTKKEIENLGKRGDIERWFKFNSVSDTANFARAKRALEVKMDSEIIREQIELNQAIRDLRAGRGDARLEAEARAKIEAIEISIASLRENKNQLNSLPLRNYRHTLGNFLGTIDYIRSVGSGDFIKGVWDGSWFNGDVSMSDSAPGKGDKYKGVNIVVPKNDLNPIYTSLSKIYYLTPGSLVKTALWNGEYFAFKGWERKNSIFTKLMTPDLANQLRASGLLTGPLDGLLKGNSFNKKVFDKNYDAILAMIAGGGFGKYSTQARKAINFHRINGKLLDYGSFFSRTLQKSMIYQNTLGDKGIKKRMMFLIGKGLMKLSKDKGWRTAVKLFAKGASGIRQLIQAGVKVVLSTLGVSIAGPIGQAIAWAVTEVALKVGMSVAKFIIKLSIVIILFILFLVPMLGTIFGIFGTPSLTSASRHIAPGEALQCVEFNPHSGLYPEPAVESGTEYPPSNSTCPLNFSPQSCTQGSGTNASSYHQSTKAIDVGTGSGTWTAPSDGGRVISYVPTNICGPTGNNYGGVIKYDDGAGNVYTIMHAKAVVPVGPVRKGTTVAVVETGLTPDHECWTGAHFHLHVSAAGSYQNAYDWYNKKLGCSVSACP